MIISLSAVGPKPYVPAQPEKVADAPVKPPPAADEKPAAEAPPAERADPPGYSGPSDGLVHYNPKAARWLRPLNNGMVHLLVRLQSVQGADNVPKSGAHMICFNHQSMADASIVSSLAPGYRFMAAKEQFVGFVGKMMTAMGAFPVDRGVAGAKKPLDVGVKELNKGNGFAIMPEGRIWEDDQVHEFKEGPAWIALHSTCESITPGAIQYNTHHAGFGRKLLHYGATAAVIGGGIAAALSGGPAVRVAVGAATGALTAFLGGAALHFPSTADKGNGTYRAVQAVKAGAWSALAGAVVGGAAEGLLGTHAIWLGAPLTAVTGMVTLAAAKALGERRDAHVCVGKPILVEPYRQMADEKEARAKLTADLHQTIVDLKASLPKK